MGFGSSLLKIAAPTTMFGDMLSSSGGVNVGDAALTGIPYIGEGFAAQQAQNFNSAQSAQQMAFQKDMSNTAHQRQAADMEKAGLNRILSAGAGASSPSGSAASGVMGTGAGHSADMLKSMYKQEGKLANTNIKATEAQTKLTQEKEATEKANQLATTQSAVESKVRQNETEQRTKNLRLQEKGLQKDAEFEENFGTDFRKANAILNSAQKVKDVLNPLRGLFNQTNQRSKGNRTIFDNKTGEIYNDRY